MPTYTVEVSNDAGTRGDRVEIQAASEDEAIQLALAQEPADIVNGKLICPSS
jgi:hypothetical protein